MQNVYTVKQVNAYVKNMFAQDFMLNRIYVKGEVSNCKYHTSGHIYFSLKDESGTIACVMFAGQRGGLSFRMREGQQVIVLGSVSVYERDGKYQLYAKEIRLDGAGLLYEKFQMLKKELEEMGMFAPEYKKPIPAYARTVGVVTAPTGAAIRDIIHIARRRNPFVQIILYPALVQGEGAASSIVRGIRALEAKGVDVMIVGRGGGSIEDLWAFNEEAVARAVFDCSIPVISAVGHETDTTIIDYVADLRAPTPSAAAELAVYEYRKIADLLRGYADRMGRSMEAGLRLGRLRFEKYRDKLSYLSPSVKLREYRQRMADYEEQIPELMREKLELARKEQEERAGGLSLLMDGKIKESRHQLAIYIERMRGLSPLAKLNQGFSYVQDSGGRNITSIENVKKEDELEIYVKDGIIAAAVTDVRRPKEAFYAGKETENGRKGTASKGDGRAGNSGEPVCRA